MVWTGWGKVGSRNEMGRSGVAGEGAEGGQPGKRWRKFVVGG